MTGLRRFSRPWAFPDGLTSRYSIHPDDDAAASSDLTPRVEQPWRSSQR